MKKHTLSSDIASSTYHIVPQTLALSMIVGINSYCLVGSIAKQVKRTTALSRKSSHRWSSVARLAALSQGRSTCTTFPCDALSRLAILHRPAVSNFSSQGSGTGGGPPKSFFSNPVTRRFGLLASGSLLFLGKGKYILGALKLGKLATLGSMFVTIGTYSMFFGFPYAVGVVGLILIHETGHALIMLRRGIPFSPMVFVPFVGAAVSMNRRPRDAWEEALVAFGGPVLGSLGALGCSLGAHATDSQLLYALADFGYMINLMNLLPIAVLDGGKIAGALSPYAGVGGVGLGGMLFYNGYVNNPIFILVLLAGGWQTFQRFQNPGITPLNYYKITPLQRASLTGGYFGLIGALLAATVLNDEFRKPPEILEKEKFWDD